MKASKIKKFVTVAMAIADLSKCQSRHVGCILTDADGYILSTGYNGPPNSTLNCSCSSRTSGKDLDLCPAVHAEMNAMLQCANVKEVYYCFVTTKPCRHCIKMLLNTGCHEIYYVEDYPHKDVTELWESQGRIITQVCS